MTQNARITTTLSGVASDADLVAMEERIMSALSDAVAQMRSAVEAAVGRTGDSGALEAAIAAERARYDALVSSEAAEDLAQDAELAAARAEVDRLLSEQNAAAGELSGLADQLNAVGTAVEEAPAGTPVEEVEVPDVAPAPETPAEPAAPAEEAPAAPAEEAPAPDTAAPAEPAAPDTGTPAEAGDVGPTDADGNPVTPPTI